MKTPDEIKKGLELCGADECHGEQYTSCPYEGDVFCVMHICGDALSYITQLEARVPKWIPVGAEEKPMHGKRYLCICSLPDDPEHEWDWATVLSYYAHGSNGYVDRPHFTDEGFEGMTVTHWMPLPEPPKEE